MPYAGERFTFRYSTCAGWKWKTWKRSSGGRRGTQGDVMHRIVHVQVTCAKRLICRRITVGGFVAVYGVKVAITFSRDGSTRCVSATTASFAVIESPNRCTVGVIEAYALKGRPSPTEEPLYTGSAPVADGMNASATSRTSSPRFTLRLATSDGGRPSAGTS